MRRAVAFPAMFLLTVLAAESPSHSAIEFATIVVEYAPAPGQFVNVSTFADPSKALGPPTGGGLRQADNTGVVTLGGFGGSITLGFDHMVRDDARNPLGLDAVVFGNAFHVTGDPHRRWAEAGVIEISLDVNGNGLADDTWYLVPGSHVQPTMGKEEVIWDDDALDSTYPPDDATWIPLPHLGGGSWTTLGYHLPADPFETGFVLSNTSDVAESVWGYADLTPTVRLGDLNADDLVDDDSVVPEAFYTVPDDPTTPGVLAGCGGGDAFDIAWAVNGSTGAPASLEGFHFIRIRTGAHAAFEPLGEISTEIDAVADVRPVWHADFDGNGSIDVFDLLSFLVYWFAGEADLSNDGATDVFDLLRFLEAWFAG